jgi:hypothetical protein
MSFICDGIDVGAGSGVLAGLTADFLDRRGTGYRP